MGTLTHPRDMSYHMLDDKNEEEAWVQKKMNEAQLYVHQIPAKIWLTTLFFALLELSFQTQCYNWVKWTVTCHETF